MKHLVRLTVGCFLSLILLSGCIPPPFFDDHGHGPDAHQDRGHGGEHGHDDRRGDDFHGDPGRDMR